MAERYEKNQLNIEIRDDADSIHIDMHGISRDREPGEFIVPLLSKWLDQSIDQKKKIIINLSDIQYLNASSISSIAKVFRRAKDRQAEIDMEYASEKKWQELIFSSFKLFETKNKSIRIEGR